MVVVVRVFVRVLRDARLVHEHLRVLVLRRLLNLEGARLWLVELVDWESDGGGRGGDKERKGRRPKVVFFFSVSLKAKRCTFLRPSSADSNVNIVASLL